FPGLRICIAHAGGALDRFIMSSNHKGNYKGDNLFFDTCTYDIDYLALAIKQWGVANIAFGTEAPGSGGAVRQESDHPSKVGVGTTSDNLLPVIDYLPDLSEEDKLTIVNKNPAKVFPGFAKVTGGKVAV
ncbi:MAG: amidohydrolase family protein, partial [Dehalococcoidia bacterium]